MRKYRKGNGGHAPGHLRGMFLDAIEAFEAWPENAPMPTVMLAVHYEPRPISLMQACGLVWNCSDILPGTAFDTLVDCGLSLNNRRTYAAAARAMSAAIKEELATPAS
jgi:hypothetical protein